MRENTWQDTYRRTEGDFDRLRTEAEWILRQRIAASGIKLHSLTSRVKAMSSLEEKARRKGYEAPLDQTPDIVGVRAVVLFRSGMSKVADIIESEFDVIDISDTVGGADDPSTFGYMSQHYEACLPHNLVGPRYEGLHGVRLEIQVRTLLMDAWANVSHYLAYKGESSIPLDLRRDFNALSGLFYVADSHFELFFGQTKMVREQAGQELIADAPDIPLNLDTLAEFLPRRFPEREHADRAGIGELTDELLGQGFSTIAELDVRLTEVDDALREHEKKDPPIASAGERDDGLFSDVGAARVSVRLGNPSVGPAKPKPAKRKRST
jgi:putative GTP pyrophosphokinase